MNDPDFWTFDIWNQDLSSTTAKLNILFKISFTTLSTESTTTSKRFQIISIKK
jgi:hypothetical protein